MNAQPDAETTAPPTSSLAKLRFWQWVMALGFLSAMPLGLLGTAVRLPFEVGLFPGVAAFAIGMNRVYTFRCPRCRRSFVMRWSPTVWQNALARKCVHCRFSEPPRPTSGH
jgi:hypothetical protein